MRPVTLLCVLLIIGCKIEIVKPTGRLMVQFLQFQSNGRLATNQLCDNPTIPGSYNPCDPQFRLTADRFSSSGSGMRSYSQYSYYSDQDNINFDSYFAGLDNPVSLISSTSWISAGQNTIWMTIEVRDVNLTVSNTNLMSTFSTQLTILSDAPATTLTLTSSNGHRLTLKYWFACDTYYVGQYCSIYCRVINGWCNSLGQKTCYYGWIDVTTDCETKHPCRSCTCRNGGSCIPQGTQNYTCLCQNGYVGRNCENCSLDYCAYYSMFTSKCDLCDNCQLALSSLSSACGSTDDTAFNAGVTIGVLLVLALIVCVALCHGGCFAKCCC